MIQTIIDDLKNQNWIKSLLEHSNVYLVGGIIRDSFLEKESKDIDIVIEGISISEISNLLIPFGKVNEVGKSFKVIKFRTKEFKGKDFDIATPRKDIKIGKGHKDFKTIKVKNIEEDLLRRDFTINSIAININKEKFIDPFDGLKDIKNHILRATDKSAFIEDPLRILRGIQLSARFKFKIDPHTLELMKQNVNLVSEISSERILGEFEKILNKGGSTEITFELIQKIGLDKILFGGYLKKDDEIDFSNLDPVSFYWSLGTIGSIIPYNFYMKKLKGNAKMGKSIQALDMLLNINIDKTKEEDLRYDIILALEKAPEIEKAVILPIEIDNIICHMNNKIIPKSFKDIPISGTDIEEVWGLKGPDVGSVLKYIHKKALMNKFNWKNREDSLNFLENVS